MKENRFGVAEWGQSIMRSKRNILPREERGGLDFFVIDLSMGLGLRKMLALQSSDGLQACAWNA